MRLGQELFVEPGTGDGYVTTDGLRGLGDQALAAGDDGFQPVKATVEVLPARPRRWWWGWWRKVRYAEGGLVAASVVIRKQDTTTTGSMARASWRNSGADQQWHEQPASATYGLAQEPVPAWALHSGEQRVDDVVVHPAEEDTMVGEFVPYVAAGPPPQVDHEPATEQLPALTGGRRERGAHRAS